MQVKVMLSNHHIHLTQEMVDRLFGEKGITFRNYLAGDGGPYATNEFVDLEGPKGKITQIRVLGPCRNYNQAEILKSDCFKLGVDAPVSSSGKTENAVMLKVIGPCGEAEIPCGILAQRHIHMDKETAEQNGFVRGQTVKVKSRGIRAITFENVLVTVGGKGMVMHVDTEEGNAALIKNGDMVEILSE
ncbi:propanediol utilization protein [Lactonifactor longoviformis]|uniref:Phosphate propanoyltransferase n=1 Tax=Lactonifactor longoviformis DSM 17459 TaxID=1122155 RepID=A0A1M4SW57_9CLOT|nr:PduL/EutD family phosphate acyltransferase [Lactonifactor longoviformis]POP32541.1 propanediol utilization protein [Lactonifactor longoviformis]SHE36454.1 putative phosphotransacetylase [Lactonifactor longoviformis DSM 17459]